MKEHREPRLKDLHAFPLAERRNLASLEDILVAPESSPPELPAQSQSIIASSARDILAARQSGAAVMLVYGAHLLRNGAALILEKMMARDWITSFSTNGAGSIHDWEYAYQGQSTESVEENVRTGRFGAWDETGRFIHLALMIGALDGAGYGESLGRFIWTGELALPSREDLKNAIAAEPMAERTAARADLLQAMEQFDLSPGVIRLEHRWKNASIFGQAYHWKKPITVHPGIGYDIINVHPMFNGAVIGRAAGIDFEKFTGQVNRLDGGVLLSIGTAIMGPQVFEKSVSCVNNLRWQHGRPILNRHSIYVVDLQDGGQWDWRSGEPPKDHPAYYLRFCKSYSRMGGTMSYACCDNLAFIHNLFHELKRRDS